MPAYDSIADAFALVADGVERTVSLSNVGATTNAFETNEVGEPVVWVKIDLSGHLPLTDGVEIPMAFSGTPGFHPYIDILKVIDATFDPTAPDYTKTDYITGAAYLGDGTDAPPPITLALTGGTGSSSGSASVTGIFYAFLGDWDYAGGEGSGTLTYTVPAPPVCFDAVDVINPDSTTASIVSGRVRETWDNYQDYRANPYNEPNQTLKFTWAADAGLYKVWVTGQAAAASNGTVWALVSVNGRVFFGLSGYPSPGTTTRTWLEYAGFDLGATLDAYDANTEYGLYPWIPLSPGDEVEVMVVSNLVDGSFNFVAFDIASICFDPDTAAPASTYCTDSVAFEGPVGDYWGSPNGWGGQKLVPDQIWTHIGVTPYNEAQFPWGVNYTDYDFVALEDGTLYAIVKDAWNAGAGTPSNEYHYVVVKKYDPGSGTWSQVATLNSRAVPTRYTAGDVSCAYDGTHVYFVWWELDTFTAGVPNRYLVKWHCKRLDPTDDSITELGTGQNTYGVSTSAVNHGSGGTFDGIASAIAFSGGDVYVAGSEYTDDAAHDQRTTVWRWNGSSWTDISPPTPGLTNAGVYELMGENSFYDVLQTMVAADANGPKNDGVTLVYSYNYFDTGAGLTRYVLWTNTYTAGSGWGTELLTDIASVEGAARLNGTFLPWSRTSLDMNLLWSEALGKLILVMDIGGTGDEIWDMFQMGASDWEVLEALAPASSAGEWRQSRNTADIGPDGNIWRAMYSDVVGVDFEPHLIKHSPGFGFGYANAAKPALGEAEHTDAQGNVWRGCYTSFYSTTHYRIRWQGNVCYVMCNLYIEPLNGASFPAFPYGEGIWVVKGSYVPCVVGGPVSMNWREARSRARTN